VSAGFYLSYAVLWFLLVVVSILVLLLYRHFGFISMGSLEGVQRDGLAVGERAPTITGSAPDGTERRWQPGELPSFVIFAAPECEPCATVLPHIGRLARVGDGSVRMLAVAEGRQESAQRLVEKFALPFECIAEGGYGAFSGYRVRVTPFAFVLNEDGRVVAKGLCNSTSRLRELLTAADLSDLAAHVPVDREETASRETRELQQTGEVLA
jgi:thiol-disulfide isomerase/thioredoxin